MKIDELLAVCEAERLRLFRGECKVCQARPDEYGEVVHGKGCYAVDEDGGGSSFVEPRDRQYESAVAHFEAALRCLAAIRNMTAVELSLDVEETIQRFEAGGFDA